MFTTFFLSLAIVAQSPPAGDDLPAQVRSLLRELDAPQKSTRDAAEIKLIELGPAALDALETLPVDASAELTLRVNRVRTELHRRRASTSLDGSRVTLDVTDAPLDEVLASIEKQAGNRLYDFRRQFGEQADPIRVTLKLDDELFWRAVDKLCAATGLKPYHFGGGDGLALVANSEASDTDVTKARPVVYAGAFRLEARRLVASREAASATPGELQVTWETAWEPRLRPLFFTVRAAKITASIDGLEDLEPLNPQLVLEVPPQGKAVRVEMLASYHAPRRSAKQLVEFKGAIEVLIPADIQKFRFAEVERGGTREERAGSVSVTLERPREADGVVALPVRIKYDNAANALESHRAWFYKNPAYLEDADGVKTEPGSIELLRQSSNELTLNLIFAPEKDWRGQTLVYGTPADIVILPIEFAFENLPLP
ncbi:MAG: hypothetical protein JNK76_06810 [Planctomycetales bacterium]|nr:hypothetical protein [Planctomycetales bacterium]MBN8624623.1 hypothetical protein [Planctomycetota bacterium]